MSLQNVQAVIGRAVTEPEYRNLLFADPDKAREGVRVLQQALIRLRVFSALEHYPRPPDCRAGG